MIVAARSLDPKVGHRPRAAFPTARAAFEAVLRASGIGPGDTVLLPAYIGWSSREGSGVYDPIAAVGATGLFVRVDGRLRVDLADFAAKLATGPKMVVVIHYFGAPDPGYVDMVGMARRAGVPVLEDGAHALLTDLAFGTTGRIGDGAIYSLHKQLPCLEGGELRVNEGAPPSFYAALSEGKKAEGALDPAEYDLHGLAWRRMANYAALREALEGCPGLRPLWEGSLKGIAPQCYPILIERADRDALYDRFRAAGFGGTSLYHTMIPEITAGEFPDSHRLARTIFNLPVHPDATPEEMRAMADVLVGMLA